MFRKGVNGIFLLLLGVAYLIFAAYILMNTDWNPRMENYTQYVLGLKGEYAALAPTENGYVGIVSAESGEYLLFLDEYGEIKKAYNIPERVYTIAVKGKNVAIFSAKDTNIFLRIFSENGSIVSSRTYSTLWTIHGGWNTIPGAEKLQGIFPVQRSSSCGVLVLDADKNTDSPSAWIAYISPCDVNFVSACWKDVFHVIGEEKYRAYYIALSPGRFSAVTITSIWGIHPKTIAGENDGAIIGGVTDDNALFVAKISGGNLSWARKIYVSGPITSMAVGDGKLYVNDTRFHVMVLGNDGNVVAHFVSDEAIYPVGSTNDVLHDIVFGSRSGSPAYVRNAHGPLSCPDNFYEGSIKIYAQMLPTVKKSDRFVWRQTPVDTMKGAPKIDTVALDEDFACYSP